MILQKRDKGSCRQRRRGFASRSAAAKRRGLALIGKAFGQGAAEMPRRLCRIIRVKANVLAGNQNMQGMVQIVVPLRREAAGPTGRTRQVASLVAVVFQNKMDFSVVDLAADRPCQLAEDVGLAVVVDRVDGIEAEPVEAIFFKPIECVVNHEVAHRPAQRSVKIERCAPWRVVPLGKEIRRDCREIISLRAEMVVDDVEKNGEATRVTGLDQPLQVVGPAIAGRRRVKIGAVIAPAAGAGKLGDRHQLDRGGAEVTNMVEVPDRAGEIASLREGAEMEFVQDDLLPGTAAPFGGPPEIRTGIDDLARTVNAFRLAARRRVGIRIAVDDITVARAWPGAVGGQAKPAFDLAPHRQDRVAKLHRDRAGARRPEAEADPVGDQLGSERKLMVPAHRHPYLGTQAAPSRSGRADRRRIPGLSSIFHRY